MKFVRGVGGRTIALLAITFLTQLAAFVRTRELASTLGGGSETDAFYAANNITVSVFNVVDAAVTTVLVPYMVRYVSQSQVKRYFRSVQAFSLLLAACISGIVWVFPGIVLPEGSSTTRSLLGWMVVILAVGQQFRAVSAVLIAAQQVGGSFVTSRLASAMVAVVPTVVLIVTADVLSLCVAVTVSYAVEAVWNRAGAGGLPYSRYGGVRRAPHRETWHFYVASAPILLSSGLFQIQMLLLTIVIARMGTGVLTLYSTAAQVVGVVQILILQNVITVIYPWLSRVVADVRRDSFEAVTSAGGIMVCGVCWIFASYVLCGEVVLRALFSSPRLPPAYPHDLYVLGLILLGALPFNVFRDVIYRYCYAKGLSRIATRNSIEVVALNVVLCVVLGGRWGVLGAVTAIVFGSVWSMLRAGGRIKEHLSGNPVTELVKRSWSYPVAVVAMIAGGTVCLQFFGESFMGVCLALVVGTFIYASCSLRGVRRAVETAKLV